MELLATEARVARLEEGKALLKEVGRLTQAHLPASKSFLEDALGDGVFPVSGRDVVPTLVIDDKNNVVLKRYADDFSHLVKSCEKRAGAVELNRTSEFLGGGPGVPTFGVPLSAAGVNHDSEVLGTFRIPKPEFLDGAKRGEIIVGNLGETEIVISPHIAQKYLSEYTLKSTGETIRRHSDEQPLSAGSCSGGAICASGAKQI